MAKYCECARAKLNLCLHVFPLRNGDDRHEVDTIIYPISLCDEITAEKSEENSVVYADGELFDNDTALLAANAIQKRYGTGGMKISIKKNIPQGAGLGGSSADAAAVARLFAKAYSLGELPKELLLNIGSDVPAMYFDEPCRVKGKGELVFPIDISVPPIAVVIPKTEVSTRQAYKTFDSFGGIGGNPDEAIADGVLVSPFNSLELAATLLNSDVVTAREALIEAGFKQVCVTGSGSAVFGFGSDDFEKSVELLAKICENNDIQLFTQHNNNKGK